MFTGIIESIGKIISKEKAGSNFNFIVESGLSKELQIDQSVAHNGVCLTVVDINHNHYTVTAIKETLDKTTLKNWQVNDAINLERAMSANARLDGHFVQGHVDQVAKCTDIKPEEGSTYFHFEFLDNPKFLLVNKGSVCIDGVSLTVVRAEGKQFSVAIIPYTLENTCFQSLKKDQEVNIEFDILGKYIERYMAHYKNS